MLIINNLFVVTLLLLLLLTITGLSEHACAAVMPSGR